jgi:hypothetical protein
MNIRTLRSPGRRIRRDRVRNEILRRAGIQNLLTGLEEKQLQLFSQVKRMDEQGY